jgi:hypothetical protein
VESQLFLYMEGCHCFFRFCLFKRSGRAKLRGWRALLRLPAAAYRLRPAGCGLPAASCRLRYSSLPENPVRGHMAALSEDLRKNGSPECMADISWMRSRYVLHMQ